MGQNNTVWWLACGPDCKTCCIRNCDGVWIFFNVDRAIRKVQMQTVIALTTTCHESHVTHKPNRVCITDMISTGTRFGSYYINTSTANRVRWSVIAKGWSISNFSVQREISAISRTQQSVQFCQAHLQAVPCFCGSHDCLVLEVREDIGEPLILAVGDVVIVLAPAKCGKVMNVLSQKKSL